MKRWLSLCLLLASCGKPLGLGGTATPLAQIHVQVTGDFASSDSLDGGTDTGFDGGVVAAPQSLRAALVWGLEWLPEPFCVLPPESSEAAAVIAAGCRDNFGFVPNRVGAEAPIVPGVPTTIELVTLPAADVMVGDITARIAYASVIIYDDRNGNGALDLRHPQRQRRRGEPITDASGDYDVIYGASFISMTEPDRRVSFLEGDFTALENVAFYPRQGCPAPPKVFSILSAGGFSAAAAISATLAGQLPDEDPASCGTATLDDTISVPLQSPAPLSQLGCTANDSGGVTYYRPPTDSVDLVHLTWACATVPRIAQATTVDPGQQLVVASPPTDACRTTLHYTVRGCDDDPFCATPSWDFTANPPSWWPCVLP